MRLDVGEEADMGDVAEEESAEFGNLSDVMTKTRIGQAQISFEVVDSGHQGENPQEGAKEPQRKKTYRNRSGEPKSNFIYLIDVLTSNYSAYIIAHLLK